MAAPDRVQHRVAVELLNGAARAYAFPRPHDEGFDPQLCTKCQRVRPTPGYLMCAPCAAEGGNV